MAELGKTFLALGMLLVALGAAMLLAARLGLPFGTPPRKLALAQSQRQHDLLHFPIATSILLNIFFSPSSGRCAASAVNLTASSSNTYS